MLYDDFKAKSLNILLKNNFPETVHAKIWSPENTHPRSGFNYKSIRFGTDHYVKHRCCIHLKINNKDLYIFTLFENNSELISSVSDSISNLTNKYTYKYLPFNDKIDFLQDVFYAKLNYESDGYVENKVTIRGCVIALFKNEKNNINRTLSKIHNINCVEYFDKHHFEVNNPLNLLSFF